MANPSLDKYKQKLKDMNARAARGGGKGSFPYNFGTIPDGKSVIRFFGPWNPESEDPNFERELAIHRDIGDEKKRLTCPKSVNAKARCPICEEVERLREKAKAFPRNSPENKKMWAKASKIAAKTRYFLNGIHLTPKGPVPSKDGGGDPTKPEVFEVGPTIEQQILKYLVGEDDMDVSGPFWEKGTRYDFIVMKTGETWDTTEYDVTPTRKYVDVDTSELEEAVHNLDEVLAAPKTYKEIESIFKGLDYDPDEDEELNKAEEEDEAPKKKATKAAPKKEEEDDDEPAPSKKAKLKVVEPDEEEDEKPALKSKKATKKPECFGANADYDANDKTCLKCEWQTECLSKQLDTAKEEGDKKVARTVQARIDELAGEGADAEAEDVIEHEDEDEKPVAKKSTKAAAKEEDDDDAVIDDEDEESAIEKKMRSKVKGKS